MVKTLRIGTRGSRLALIQTNMVCAAIDAALGPVDCTVVEIKTQGDMDQESRIADTRATGLFVREIETALLTGQIDMAVHSLKDLPTVLPHGLILGGVLERGDRRDACVTRDGCAMAELPGGATVATGSNRRQAQVLAQRPDCRVVPVRGNVDTRIRKLMEGRFDALLVGAAALDRLGSHDGVKEILDSETFIPAPAQGVVGLEICTGEVASRAAVSAVSHEDTWECAMAERAFLRRLGSGCSLPAGATASIEGDEMIVLGFLSETTGQGMVRAEVRGPRDRAEDLGEDLATGLMESGGAEILQALEGRSNP